MTTLTDHDQRQLKRMAERLDLFANGKLALRVLVADIEFLLGALDADETVRRRLREPWTVLEEVYSVSVAMRDGKLDEQSESLIKDAVRTLRTHVTELVGAPDL